ncbi:MAG: nickel pincer cofactor biosynthesis protein LarB [Tyzzerella sp.]|uniref:Nickel pincer cofactor biosynthesis protein LarB n=1 Tax=Candidatus Fimicola merdigallinarum TaxID=2840819 RepID=A0A9D9H4D9_9FIRM|nr:nickel pincer cofactor biosynthesis protein LarB [Candidatus Fimicola merdigallinarum]
MDTRAFLEKFKNGEIDIEEAENILKKLPYEDLGFAKLDHHRKLRSGFGEVVYCSGKTEEHLVKIFKSFYDDGVDVLGTRASLEQFEAVKKLVPKATYDELSRIIKIQSSDIEKKGLVAVCTGGTSDIPVAEETAQTAEFFGCNVLRVYDVGVAGIHRLLSRIDDIKRANCIVAVAGMEGALAGVIAGLVDKPVIAVPTSVGYGANFGGLSALLTMLNSCAEGVSVVNIDNGFGAGYMSAQINRMVVDNNG